MAFDLYLFAILLFRKTKFSHKILWLLQCKGFVYFFLNKCSAFVYICSIVCCLYSHRRSFLPQKFCICLSVYCKTLSSCGGLFWHSRTYSIFLCTHHFNSKIAEEQMLSFCPPSCSESPDQHVYNTRPRIVSSIKCIKSWWF